MLICNFKFISLLLHGTNSQLQSPPAALNCKAVKTLQRWRGTQQSDDAHEQHLDTVEGEGGAAKRPTELLSSNYQTSNHFRHFAVTDESIAVFIVV